MAQGVINIRRPMSELNPSIQINYMFQDQFTRISIQNLMLVTNNKGVRKYKGDLNDFILRISMQSSSEDFSNSPVYLGLLMFQIEDKNEYLNFVLNDFTVKHEYGVNRFETSMTSEILRINA